LRGWNLEAASPVGVLAVSAVEQQDNGLGVSDLVPDAIVADADAVFVHMPSELDGASWARVVLHEGESCKNSGTDFPR